ncbi:MAG: hypothetical protein QOC56_16, partial [Alphaproteobacteria bacterium]|nr:hypothetical protein [Alphaproteobacteria bacterium]
MSRLRIIVINSKQSSLPDRRSASYMHAESRRPMAEHEKTPARSTMARTDAIVLGAGIVGTSIA